MLHSRPGLFTQELFSISEKIVAETEQRYQFYLRSGSQITVSVCFVDGAAIIPLTGLYLVKGTHGYDGTHIMRSDLKSVVAEFAIFYKCNDSAMPFSYTVEDDDFYYLIFQTATLGDSLLHLNVNVSLHSTHYSLYNTTTTSSCSLSTPSNESTCSVSVPLSTRNYALLTIHPEPSDVDKLELETHCEPRLWVYVVPPLLLMCMLICASCCHFCIKENHKCKTFFFCYWIRKSVKGRILILSCSLMIILISAILCLRFTVGSSYSNEGQSYGPTDTRLVPFSNLLCQGLSLQTNFNGTPEYNISFFMLPSQPELFQSENYTISERITAEIVQHYIFYMHSGSEIIVHACFVDSNNILPLTRLYIVKGVHGYNGGYLRSDIKSVVAEFSISVDCTKSRTPFYYSIEMDDFYYLIFHTGVLGIVPVLHLNVNMLFHSTHYSYNDIANSCTLSTSNYGSVCSLGVPFFAKRYALLAIHPISADVDRLDQIPLETHCHPRLWLYILPPLLLLYALYCASCCCFLTSKTMKWKRLNSYCVQRVVHCKSLIFNWFKNRFKYLIIHWFKNCLKSKKCIICYCSPYLLVIILISIILGLRFTIGSFHTNGRQSYGPTDTRLIPFSNSFCQSLTLKTKYSGSDEYKLSFFMLRSQPGLFAHENFTISVRVVAAVEQHYRFYMYSGSEVTVSACFVNSAVIVPLTWLYIVRGDGYNGGYLSSDDKSVVTHHNISYNCMNTVASISYSIRDADFYYFVFYTSNPGVPVLYLDVKMSFYHIHYAVYDDPVISSCTLSTSNYGSMCSVSVPLSTRSYALLTIHPESSDVDRLDEVPLETHCEPRLWVYVVPPFLLISMLVCASCCCYCMKKSPNCKQFICCSTKCRRLTCYGIPYSLLAILIGTVLGLHFSVGSSFSNEGQSYGPTDTRLIPFSNILCQSLSLRTNSNGSREYNISFFMLPSKPQLFELENYTISETIAAKLEQHYLFYMHSGSQIIVSACFVDNATVVPFTSLYIVKGVHGYNGEYLRSDIKSVVAKSDISYDCETSVQTSYYVEDDYDDFYYIIFHTSVLGNIPVLNLNVKMSLYRTHYAVFNDPITSSCTLSTTSFGSMCSLNVPLSTKSYALLTVHPESSDVDRLDEVPLETHCEPRLWVYVVPPFLLISMLVCASCCCYCMKKSPNCKQFICCSTKCRRLTCYGIPYSLLAILIGTVLGLHFSVGSSFSNEGQSYGPTDTRLIPFSNILCQSLSLRTNSNGSREYNISFFMLPSKPQLFELENYTISETIAAKLEQHYLFYMHSGSQIIVSACFVDNATVVPFTSLYIVKGVHGYNGEYLRSDIKSVVAKSDISYDCETSVQTSYYVEDDYDDFYYIIFHTSVLGNIPVLNLNVKMSLYRTHYAVFNDPITSSCTLSTTSFGSMCSLNVPLSTKSYALLTIHPESSDVDRLDEVPLETHCEPRLWVYIVPPLLLMCMLICASCCCYCMKKNSSCKQFNCCSAKCRRFTCYCIPYSLVIILIGTALGVRFTIGSSYSNEGQRYGPTDTRLIPFSNIFCQSLSLQTNFNDLSEYNISFFMLPSQPQLYEHENFSISEKVVAEVEQHYLFYMHSGSQVIVSACFVDSAAFVPFTSLYIVKGVHGYDGGYLRGDIKSIVAEFAISYNCRNNSFSYYVENGDFYFLIFQASVSGVVPVLRLNVNMSFDLTLYAIQYGNTVASSCSLSSLNYRSKCSVSVPMSYKSYALLSIHPLSFNVNRLDEIPLETHCDPRLWVYVLPPFVLTLLVICINGLCCAYKCTTTIRSASESEFASIKDKFRRDWTKGTALNVKAIFVIKNKTSTKMKWYACKVSLVCRSCPGHREMYYHGTNIFCKIMGDKRLCSREDCSVCGISLNGFKRSKIRRGFQRFGPGFYLAPNSSKANDYAQKQGTRAMLLCDVRPGEKKRMTHTNQHTQFAGYQSIYGDIGGDLNYPEIVISNPNAILPRYIIVYSEM